MAVTLIDPSDPTTALATFDWDVEIQSDSEGFIIGTIVEGFYSSNSSEDDAVVTVSKPLFTFVTGGGYTINESSAGIYAGDIGAKTNFGLNVSSKRKPKGKVTIIIRSNDHCSNVCAPVKFFEKSSSPELRHIDY